MLADVRTGLRYARGLSRYLSSQLDPSTIDSAIRAAYGRRDLSFLSIVEHAIYARPDSPYRPLLASAGVELGDIVTLVHADGIEAALDRLYDAGVHVSLDEFKGSRPIVRPGLTVDSTAASFDNPLAVGDFALSSSGSRGQRRRMLVDLTLLEHEAVIESVLARELEGLERPLGMWRPVPPGVAGLKIALRAAKQGRPIRVWFSQEPMSFRGDNARHSVLTAISALVGRARGGLIPWPQHVPLGEAWRVAAWLASQRAGGPAAVLDTSVSSAVRVCRAALDRGLDISGTVIRLGGEPYTSGKARLFVEAGARAFVNYSMAELGRIGLACAAPEAPDDVHVMEEKVAVIQRPQAVGGGATVDALFITTVHPASPKVMLNVDSGDYARLTRRRCGCPFDALGYQRHLLHIRSHDKLTTEGMHFIGDDVMTIIDQVLPSKFGGNPTDYQFVEREEGGLTKVNLVVSPRLGPLDEAELRRVVLDALASGGAVQSMMVERWRSGDTLRVERREPYATSTAKILALHHVGPAS
jgi:hypothetical protein